MLISQNTDYIITYLQKYNKTHPKSCKNVDMGTVSYLFPLSLSIPKAYSTRLLRQLKEAKC